MIIKIRTLYFNILKKINSKKFTIVNTIKGYLVIKLLKQKVYFYFVSSVIYSCFILYFCFDYVIPLVYKLGFFLIPSLLIFFLVVILLVYSDFYHKATPLYYLINILIYFLFCIIFLFQFFSIFNINLDLVSYLSSSTCFDFFIMSPTIWFSNFLIFLLSFFLICLYINIHHKNFGTFGYKENVNYIIMIIFLILGLSLLISSNNYMILYLSLEIIGFILYVMIGMENKYIFSIEASLKYFIFNAIVSGFFLFLLVVLFYNYGSLNYLNIELMSLILEYDWCKIGSNYVFFFDRLLMLQIGIGLIFFFKLGLAPLHFWLPDVYEGSSLITLVFLGIVVKLGYFVTYLRFLETIPLVICNKFISLIYFFGLLSIFFGSLGALRQKSLKRFLAYTSITNLGYIILCTNFDTVLAFWYFISYILLNFVFFSIIIILNKKHKLIYIEDLLKVKYNYFLIFFFFIFAALPPSPLFFFKSFLLLHLYSSLSFFSIISVILGSLISIYYYLRLITILISPENFYVVKIKRS